MQKRDFTTDFTLSAQNSNCESLFPPTLGVKRLLAYYTTHSAHTEQKQKINT